MLFVYARSQPGIKRPGHLVLQGAEVELLVEHGDSLVLWVAHDVDDLGVGVEVQLQLRPPVVDVVVVVVVVVGAAPARFLY